MAHLPTCQWGFVWTTVHWTGQSKFNLRVHVLFRSHVLHIQAVMCGAFAVEVATISRGVETLATVATTKKPSFQEV